MAPGEPCFSQTNGAGTMNDWLSEHRMGAAKRRLAERFIADLKTAWAEHGADVMEEVKREDPILYRKIMSQEEPK
jgi:hypothetical protein